MARRWAIVSTTTYTNGWEPRAELGPPLWSREEAERVLAATHDAILANNRGPITITRMGAMLTTTPVDHFGPCSYRIVPDDRPVTIDDPRPDVEHEQRDPLGEPGRGRPQRGGEDGLERV